MPHLIFEISRYVEDYFPGIIECTLIDAVGAYHTFVVKVPTVTWADLSAESKYPQPGAVRGEIAAQWNDGDRALVRFSTADPDGVESVSGISTFVVFADQVQA